MMDGRERCWEEGEMGFAWSSLGKDGRSSKRSRSLARSGLQNVAESERRASLVGGWRSWRWEDCVGPRDPRLGFGQLLEPSLVSCVGEQRQRKPRSLELLALATWEARPDCAHAYRASPTSRLRMVLTRGQNSLVPTSLTFSSSSSARANHLFADVESQRRSSATDRCDGQASRSGGLG